MSCFGYLWDEFLGLGRLAIPTLIVNGLEISMTVIDLIFLGHISSTSLTIGAIGTVYYNILWYINEGLLSAQDSLTSNSFEMKDYDATRYWSYISAIVLGITSILETIIFLLSPIIVTSIFRLGNDTSTSTSYYVMALIPALWFHTGFRIIQKYFNCQNIITPVITSMIIGLFVKIFINFITLNVIETGSVGAAISTSISRGIMFFIIFIWLATREGFLLMRNEFLSIITKESQEMLSNWLYSQQQQQQQQQSSSSSSSEKKVEMTLRKDSNNLNDDNESDRSLSDEEDTDALLIDYNHGASSGTWKNRIQIDCLRFLALGFPGAIVLMIEMWSYEIAILVMSQIGPVSVSAQQILICWTNVMFVLIPLSFSIASTIRINRLLISQNPDAAKLSSYVSIIVSILFMIISGVVLFEVRFVVGYLFTSDSNIISRVRQLAPIVAIFQVINGIQGCCQGILRGMYRHNELVGYTFLSYWIIAMPFGLYLAFYTRPRTGILGIWYGFITGLGLLSIVLLTIILTTDWEREVRRARIRVEKFQQNSLNTIQTMPLIGGRSLGGFMLINSIGDEELDDLERIEVLIDPDQ